jgi:hypothetical protein
MTMILPWIFISIPVIAGVHAVLCGPSPDKVKLKRNYDNDLEAG